MGVALTIALIGVKVGVEHTEFGQQLELMTYNLLQLRLLSSSGGKDLPVTVVDISGVGPVAVERGGTTKLVTPRGPLLEIVKAIGRQKPRAIGIDVDFSPDEWGFITPDDPSFLQSCLRIRREGIPVYVGIYDSVVLDPGKWLGSPEFRALAAYISVPRPEHTEPATRMIEWVQPAGVSERCLALANALAAVEQEPIPRVLEWAVERESRRSKDEFAASEFLIDYGPLERFLKERVVARSANDVASKGDGIRNTVVIVGRATPEQTMDRFNVPGRGEAVPGVYVHAAATYTLLQAPLYRLTHVGRVAADALVALLVFGPILLVRLHYNRRIRSDIPEHRLQLILTTLAILSVILVGHVLVDKIRLMWTDYLMVIGAFLLHSPAERRLHGARGSTEE